MTLYFRTRKLQKICSDKTAMVKAVGSDCAKKLKQRLTELKAAATLANISHLPPARLHLLDGNRQGQFSVDVKHPYRLLFIVADDPIPTDDNGGIDKSKVLSVEIIGISDTHG